MVLRGDTIVYNADAFNLADGSMLEALIRRLPGTKLNKDGQIFVNGKYVESLLVNGKNFFGGNPKIALENLPAYTVKNIKVYDKSGIATQVSQKDMDDKTYVMDVKLKKEYSVDYMGNVEIGKGTSKRYQTKMFSMGFSNLDRIIGYANLNNLNGDQRIGLDGDWNEETSGNGLHATKTTGISYQRCLNSMGSEFTSENTWTHTNLDICNSESEQTFLKESDLFRRSINQNEGKLTSINSVNVFNLLMRGCYITEEIRFGYSHNCDFKQLSSTTTNSASILNHLWSESTNKSTKMSVRSSFQGGINLFGVDMLRWGNTISIERKTTDTFFLNHIQYNADVIPRDERNNYFDNFNQHMEIGAHISYNYRIRERYVQPRYAYSFKYDKTSSLLYRLDKLSKTDSLKIEMLPSVVGNLCQVLDAHNSFNFHEYQNLHRMEIIIGGREKWLGKKGLWRINLPLRFEHHNMFYFRENWQDVSKKIVFFEPSIYISHTPQKTNSLFIDFDASIHSQMPDLVLLADYQEDYDPLNIRKGNPNLKTIHNYDVSVKLRKESKNQMVTSLLFDYHQQDHAIAYKLEADRTTGVYSTQPVSINGNWHSTLVFGVAGTIDKKKRFTIDSQTGCRYTHLVDMLSINQPKASLRSIVNNWRIDETITLNYHPNGLYEFKVWASGKYHLLNSHQDNYSKIKSGDYWIGMATDIDLPYHFHIMTDFTMNIRRGYQQEELNTTDYVWNAQINRSFLGGNILVTLRGFDLLRQLSNIEYYVNPHGRTESSTNSIPRYIMFSILWKFNVNPHRFPHK